MGQDRIWHGYRMHEASHAVHGDSGYGGLVLHRQYARILRFRVPRYRLAEDCRAAGGHLYHHVCSSSSCYLAGVDRHSQDTSS